MSYPISVVYPDGSAGEFSFVADDQGARFESPLLPIGPEIPQHALEQIAFAEEERWAICQLLKLLTIQILMFKFSEIF